MMMMMFRCVSGVGKGLVGVLTRPASGVVDFASSSFEGIRRYSHMFSLSAIVQHCFISVVIIWDSHHDCNQTSIFKKIFRCIYKILVLKFQLLNSSLFTVWSSYASAVLGIVILSVRPSVCLSVTRVLCDETIEHTADILISYEMVIILVFWYQQRLVGDVPFHLKFALKVIHPMPTSTNICFRLNCKS